MASEIISYLAALGIIIFNKVYAKVLKFVPILVMNFKANKFYKSLQVWIIFKMNMI